MKLVMQRCKVPLPSKDIADQSTVFKCTAAGSILVLYWTLIMLYMLVHASRKAATESVRALNHLPACTLTVGQSDMSPMV